MTTANDDVIHDTAFPALTELAARPQWVCWKYEIRDGKETKIPYDPRTCTRASTDNPSSWCDYDMAKAATGYSGIGFVFTADDPYAGIDLDDCLDEIEDPLPWAKPIIQRFSTYTEVSPGGRGVKMWVRGSLPPGRKRSGQIELYDRGRYFTFTGNHLAGTPLTIEDRGAELLSFHAEMFPAPSKANGTAPAGANGHTVGDTDLIDKIRRSKQGLDFNRLWAGDTSGHGGDDSAADLALCNILAFWTSGDRGRIDHLFRQSGLYRQKWEREDYRTWTINKALEGRVNFYEPGRKSGGETPADDAPSEPLPEPVPAHILCRDHPELRPPVLDGLLRETETMNMIAVAKRGKTFLALGLALSLATGREWLGRFRVSPGRVLYVDAELHPQTMAKRIATVSSAMGIFSEEFTDRLDVLSLRGRLRDIYGLGSLFKRNERGHYRVIILDALYRLIPAGIDENSNSEMTAVYNAIDRYGDETGAAFVIVHHTSKGMQGHKSVVDVGAGAGAQARATDSHLILRDHEDPNGVVVDAACRSWPPVDPFCLRWDYPLWKLAEDLDPSLLRQEGKRRTKKDPDDSTVAEKPKPWSVPRFAAEVLGPKPQTDATIYVKAKELGLSERHAKQLLQAAIEAEKAHRWKPSGPREPHRYATEPPPLQEVPK